MRLPAIPPPLALAMLIVLFGLAGALDRDTNGDPVTPAASHSTAGPQAYAVRRAPQQLRLLCQVPAEERHEAVRRLVRASVEPMTVVQDQSETGPARELRCTVIDE
jgi:hypothetical protein